MASLFVTACAFLYARAGSAAATGAERNPSLALVQKRAQAVKLSDEQDQDGETPAYVYSLGANSSGVCPNGTTNIITPQLCQDAAQDLATKNVLSTNYSDPQKPYGCIFDAGNFFFNVNMANTPSPTTTPVCIQGISLVAGFALGCPVGTVQIGNRAACEIAADDLQTTWEPNFTKFRQENNLGPGPAGCVMHSDAVETSFNDEGVGDENSTQFVRLCIPNIKMTADPHILFNGTMTTLHLPTDRYTRLLRQGDVSIYAKGGPSADIRANYMYHVSVRVADREVVHVQQKPGRLDARQPELFSLAVDGMAVSAEGGEDAKVSTEHGDVEVSVERDRVRVRHLPSRLEFVVASRRTTRRDVPDSHHLNLRFEGGVVTAGADAAVGTLPQVWGTQPLTKEVAAMILNQRTGEEK